MTYAKERCFNTFPLETNIENNKKRRYDKMFDLRILTVIIMTRHKQCCRNAAPQLTVQQTDIVWMDTLRFEPSGPTL